MTTPSNMINRATLLRCLTLIAWALFQSEKVLALSSTSSDVSAAARSSSGFASGESGILRNSKWILTQHPQKGEDFQASKHASFVPDQSIDVEEIVSDHIIIQMEAIGVDAFIRTILDSATNAVHGGALPIGSTLPAIGYGTVISSPVGSKFKKGERVMGFLGAQSIATVPENQSGVVQLEKVRRRLRKNEPLLSGISRLTAYVGLHKVLGAPKRGQTVVVSAAAGGVGCYAAQLATLLPDTRVVGITGGQTKADFLLNELKLDAVVDYKHPTRSTEEQLQEACPNGIDFYFDNVGGPLLDLVLKQINRHARIIICGAISQYSNINHGSIYGPSNYIKLAEKSSQMAGFVLSHYHKNLKTAKWKMQYLLMRRKVKSYEQVFDGVDSFGNALEQLFRGGNIGKIVVDVTGDLKTENE